MAHIVVKVQCKAFLSGPLGLRVAGAHIKLANSKRPEKRHFSEAECEFFEFEHPHGRQSGSAPGASADPAGGHGIAWCLFVLARWRIIGAHSREHLRRHSTATV